MTIKKATFWNTSNINDNADNKSALDRLNEYIIKEQISKCDVINVETSTDCEGNRCLNLFYWESLWKIQKQ